MCYSGSFSFFWNEFCPSFAFIACPVSSWSVRLVDQSGIRAKELGISSQRERFVPQCRIWLWCWNKVTLGDGLWFLEFAFIIIKGDQNTRRTHPSSSSSSSYNENLKVFQRRLLIDRAFQFLDEFLNYSSASCKLCALYALSAGRVG